MHISAIDRVDEARVTGFRHAFPGAKDAAVRVACGQDGKALSVGDRGQFRTFLDQHRHIAFEEDRAAEPAPGRYPQRSSGRQDVDRALDCCRIVRRLGRGAEIADVEEGRFVAGGELEPGTACFQAIGASRLQTGDREDGFRRRPIGCQRTIGPPNLPGRPVFAPIEMPFGIDAEGRAAGAGDQEFDGDVRHVLRSPSAPG